MNNQAQTNQQSNNSSEGAKMTQTQTNQQSNNSSITPVVNANTPMNTTQTSQNQTNQQPQNVSVAPATNPNPITPVPSAQVAGSDGFLLVAFTLVLTVFYAVLTKKSDS